MTDVVDNALKELAVFAAGSGSNIAIVEQVNAVRALRKAERAEAAAQAAHVTAMRQEVCSVLNITPGALIALPADYTHPGVSP